VVGIRDEHKQPYILMASGAKYYFAECRTVFCSIDLDDLWSEDTLPYAGRMMIPLLIPGLDGAFPGGAESLHYSSCEFQTRVTEMKVITRHQSPDNADSDRGPRAAWRRAVLSEEHDRLRARKQSLYGKSVSTAIRTDRTSCPASA
jgi:hypothetical protein